LEKAMEGFIEIKENSVRKGDRAGAKAAWSRDWKLKHFILSGTKLTLFEVGRINAHEIYVETSKVVGRTIELTEHSYVKELRLDRDRQGICDGKKYVMNLITACPVDEEDLMVTVGGGALATWNESRTHSQRRNQDSPQAPGKILDKTATTKPFESGLFTIQDDLTNKLDILIHCPNQEEYDSLLQAFREIRRQHDDSNLARIKDGEHHQAPSKRLQQTK